MSNLNKILSIIFLHEHFDPFSQSYSIRQQYPGGGG
jgi:hypothetical protein